MWDETEAVRRKIWTPTVRQALIALIIAVAAAIVDALTGLIGVV